MLKAKKMSYQSVVKMSSGALDKSTIRKEVKEKLSRLSSDEKSRQSQAAIRKLFALPEFQSSKRISTYLSTESEISTVKVLERIFELNKICFVPRYNRDSMEMVRLMSMADYESLPMTKWNIKQPELSERRENALETGGLDLIIVPGVAFTTNGHRCGHGRGYYDKFLKSVKNPEVLRTVALAFKEQIYEEIPTAEHDVVIGKVLTPD